MSICIPDVCVKFNWCFVVKWTTSGHVSVSPNPLSTPIWELGSSASQLWRCCNRWHVRNKHHKATEFVVCDFPNARNVSQPLSHQLGYVPFRLVSWIGEPRQHLFPQFAAPGGSTVHIHCAVAQRVRASPRHQHVASQSRANSEPCTRRYLFCGVSASVVETVHSGPVRSRQIFRRKRLETKQTFQN